MFGRSSRTLRGTPVDSSQARFKGEILTETPFSAGGIEHKKLLTITIGGVATTFVEREADPYYEQAWLAFRSAGLPVAPTLHRSSRNTLLVADVKADGSEIYGKSFVHSMGSSSDAFRRSPEADARFIELMEHEKENIHQAALHLAEIAASQSVRLPCDDPIDLRVQPNGEWGLISLDLGGAVVPANLTTGNERFLNETPDPANFHAENREFVEMWQYNLDAVHRALKRQQ